MKIMGSRDAEKSCVSAFVKVYILVLETTVDLFYKLTPELYYSLISLIVIYPRDAKAIRQIQFYDNELRLA